MSRKSDYNSFRHFAKLARWTSLLGPAAAGVLASSMLSAHAANAAETPVRINRTFFQKAYQQSLQIEVNGSALDYSGAGSWKEHATELPAPAPDENTGPVLADFRDFKACSTSDKSGAVAVCFNVMPDVSSVGLNAREMKVEGLTEAVPSDCSEAASQIAFKGAKRSPYPAPNGQEFYTAEFSNDAAAGSKCAVTLKVTFTR